MLGLATVPTSARIALVTRAHWGPAGGQGPWSFHTLSHQSILSARASTRTRRRSPSTLPTHHRRTASKISTSASSSPMPTRGRVLSRQAVSVATGTTSCSSAEATISLSLLPKAVVNANLPGQESGKALADVIFGDVNPSGKLPYTIGKSLRDYGPGGKVMYLPNGLPPQQDFKEGLYFAYRHFDKHGIEPRFEFGFGLSYTTFEFENLVVSPGKAKEALPSPRPTAGAMLPEYDKSIPSEKEALFPDGFRRLEKYIYPYLDSVDDIVTHPYPYPDGYDTVQPPSGAGGDEGGNPDLWDTYVHVSVDVKNTGAKPGKVVAQLYMAYPVGGVGNVDFPTKVLRGFDKVMLEQGESKTISFNLTRRDVSYWDVEKQNWVMVTEGRYTFMVGHSSRDLTVMGSW